HSGVTRRCDLGEITSRYSRQSAGVGGRPSPAPHDDGGPAPYVGAGETPHDGGRAPQTTAARHPDGCRAAVRGPLLAGPCAVSERPGVPPRSPHDAERRRAVAVPAAGVHAVAGPAEAHDPL